MRCFLLLVILFPIMSLAFAADPEPGLFSETEGLLSVEAENYSAMKGWSSQRHYSGMGMRPDGMTGSGNGYIHYQVYFSTPGTYNLYILGSRTRSNPGTLQSFQVTFSDSARRTLTQRPVEMVASKAPQWFRLEEGAGKATQLRISSPGQFCLEISPLEGQDYILDKIVIRLEGNGYPSGTGPAASARGKGQKTEKPAIVLPPAWAFGILYGGYTNQQETLAAIDSLISGGFPIDAFWIDSYFWDANSGKGPKGYIDFRGDTTAFPDAGALWQTMEKLSVKSGVWVWDCINEKGNEAVFNEFKNRGYFSTVYPNTNPWHNAERNTLTGDIDFSNPEAATYWKSRLKPFFDQGLDFLKLDKSAAIPYCHAAFTASQEYGLETEGRGFILAHIMDIHDDRFRQYPTNWTGDAKICWTQPDYPDLGIYAMGGFKENIAMVADPRLSTYEVPFLTHDAGGYDYFGSTEQSEELYSRWIQFSAMNSIMTIFSTAKNVSRNHPYNYSEAVRANFRKYTHLRMRLFPYLYSEALKSRLTDRKMLQGDGINKFQYLLGDQLLVAPVFEKGATRREVYLPEGKWIDFETDSVFEGSQYLRVYAPLEKLPLFVKEGSILPFRNYARAIELGSNDTLTLEIYPSSQPSQYALLEDDGTSRDYEAGVFSTTRFHSEKTGRKGLIFRIDPVQGSFKGMKDERVYILHIHHAEAPGKVKMDGRRIEDQSLEKETSSAGYRYSSQTRILTVYFTANTGSGSVLTIK
jgi:hypothetical protein